MTSRRYGTEVLQFDADTFGLAMTGEALAMYYTEEVPPPAEVFLFSPSSALHAIKNPRPVTTQSQALIFHQSLTMLTLCHRSVHIYLIWAPGMRRTVFLRKPPVDPELEGQ